MSYRNFRSELAREMGLMHKKKLEDLENVDSLSIPEDYKKEVRKKISEEFNKKVDEIRSGLLYQKAFNVHVAEMKKTRLLKKYESAIKDVVTKEKEFEDMANATEKKEIKFEIPKFKANGRSNSREDLDKIMLILDSLSDDALNEMACEFYKKGWILLLLKNQKFEFLQEEFFDQSKKSNKDLEITFSEWKKMLKSGGYVSISKYEKQLLKPFRLFLNDLFFEKMEKTQDKKYLEKSQGWENGKGKNEWDVQNGGEVQVVSQSILQSEEQIPGEDDSELIWESGEEVKNWEKSVEQEWWVDENEVSENGESVEIEIGEYSVKIMKSKNSLGAGACFGKVKKCIENRIEKMGIEYDHRKIKNLPRMIFNKVISIVWNKVKTEEWGFYYEGISNLIKDNQFLIDIIWNLIKEEKKIN